MEFFDEVTKSENPQSESTQFESAMINYFSNHNFNHVLTAESVLLSLHDFIFDIIASRIQIPDENIKIADAIFFGI